MESDGFFSWVGKAVKAVAGVAGINIGGGTSKKTTAQLNVLSQKVDIMAAENTKQSKLILYIGIGVAVLAFIIVFFVVLKKRRR